MQSQFIHRESVSYSSEMDNCWVRYIAPNNPLSSAYGMIGHGSYIGVGSGGGGGGGGARGATHPPPQVSSWGASPPPPQLWDLNI